jgi:hypothetical protein
MNDGTLIQMLVKVASLALLEISLGTPWVREIIITLIIILSGGWHILFNRGKY